jgi:hypothetical protein
MTIRICDPTEVPHNPHDECPGLPARRPKQDETPLLEEPLDREWRVWPSGVETGDWTFGEHKCWVRMMVYPDPDDDTQPSHVVCQGCGRNWRLVADGQP